eukprot:NODE_140_length_17926_cov_0.139620.p8 type:complete len:272 gc:universal NODE_140_length_17926_cov_0.139620:7002-6187(-)
MEESFKSLEYKIDKLRKRNDSHMTPRKQRYPDNYEVSKHKWDNLKDSLIKLRSEKNSNLRQKQSHKNSDLEVEELCHLGERIKSVCASMEELKDSNFGKTSKMDNNKAYPLPVLWSITYPTNYNVYINKTKINWNPPVVLLRIQDVEPLYEFGYFESAYLLLIIIGNSNITPYFTQKQNTTARFFRQWANIELSYMRFDEAIEVLEIGIEMEAQPISELINSRDKIRNRLIANKKDSMIIKITPLQTPVKSTSYSEEDSFVDTTPTKSFSK